MSVENLMITTFSQVFKKYLYPEMVIGQLAHVDFKSAINKGEEVNIIMPGCVTLSDHDGGDLADAETAGSTIVKVKIDKAKSVHFKVEDAKKKQIEDAPTLEQKVNLAKDYAMDAVKQFAASVDKAYGNLYARAGIALNNGGSAYTVSATNVRDIFAYMKAKFERGDGKGHTSWVDGEMIAIIPPEMQFFLTKIEEFKGTESGVKNTTKGYVGELSGWKILCSNNIASPSANVYMPLFGQKGKTLAGGVQDDFKLIDYIPDNSFDIHYKGKGVYGVGAPNATIFGTAMVQTSMTIGA